MTIIDIQPPSDVYDTFGRLNYKPWYALAEFIDNSTQNAFDHERMLRGRIGPDRPLVHVRVTHDANSITVTDDAHGMNIEEFTRAMRLNMRPPDRTGRSEFGMGLKTAACWFGRRWTLTSSRLGDPVEYSVTFDLEEFVRSRPTTLEVKVRAVPADTHGTILEIAALRNRIYGRQIEVLKKSITSMYRSDLTSGRVVIDINRERLAWAEPPLHTETLPDGSTSTWRKPMSVDVVDPHTEIVHAVHGWVGIRDVMSRKENGFALLRRGRLIIGGYDAGWRPGEIFGQVGSARWGRLTGELHCDSFPVNFSKDGFSWDSGLEEALIDALAPHVSEYRQKADNIRRGDREVTPKDLDQATREIEDRYAAGDLVRDLARMETPVPRAVDPAADAQLRSTLIQQSDGPSELRVPLPGGGHLLARLFLQSDRPGDDWMTPSFAKADEVDVFLNTAHPYVAAVSKDERSLHIVIQFALATALAEKRARYVGGETIRPDDIRMHLDTFLRHAAPV